MFDKFANIFRIPDLRKRVLFTLGLLAVYRLGSFIPTPGINADLLAQFFNQNSSSLLGLGDLFTGGNLRRLTIFALGIMPYITASIIFQLLTVIYEPLAKLQKEGELGRRKITQWTRYVTVVLAAVQSGAIAISLNNASGGYAIHPGPGFILMTILTLTTGTAFIRSPRCSRGSRWLRGSAASHKFTSSNLLLLLLLLLLLRVISGPGHWRPLRTAVRLLCSVLR